MFEGMEAKEKERQWLKNQQTGDLDDNRLVDGATGERNVYKRRGMAMTLLLWCYHLLALTLLQYCRQTTGTNQTHRVLQIRFDFDHTFATAHIHY